MIAAYYCSVCYFSFACSEIRLILISLLPAATKLWPRLCFYSCLWFCPQGVSSREPPLTGRPPGKEKPPLAGRPTGEGDPPGKEVPLARKPRPARRPPWQGDPPARRPLQGDPPGQGDSPWQGEHPLWQGDPPLARRPPAGRPPLPYGQWAAGTHPTGMHSCLVCACTNYRLYVDKKVRLLS